ncbi:MAG: hypothetical protein DUD35_13940 [Lactobacillus sp.]|nr:MAG: hypothetical protein DUD35_13940 [Lactobacillus sp.]
MYHQQTMDSVIDALGGEDAIARIIGAYRFAIEKKPTLMLTGGFDDLKIVDSRPYVVRDFVKRAFADQMQLLGFDVRQGKYGASWWTDCVATGKGLSVTTCKIDHAGAKLPRSQFVNSMRVSNQMALPLFFTDGEHDGQEVPLRVVLAYHVIRHGGKPIFGGLEIVLPVPDGGIEMRKDITYLDRPASVAQPVTPQTVVRVKVKRSVVNGRQ